MIVLSSSPLTDSRSIVTFGCSAWYCLTQSSAVCSDAAVSLGLWVSQRMVTGSVLAASDGDAGAAGVPPSAGDAATVAAGGARRRGRSRAA